MNHREIRAHVLRKIRAAERSHMTARVADVMREQVSKESGRYRFALDRARGLAHGRREARDRAFKRFSAAAFAIADVAQAFSMAARGGGGSKV